MTREEAREYFKNCNLSYENLDINNIYKLIQMLNKKITEANSIMIMINEPRLKGSNKDIIMKNGKIIFAQIRVKGDYFDSREAITFNKNGFIGFCSWASDDNTQPFIDAFKEWCDFVRDKNSKEAK